MADRRIIRQQCAYGVDANPESFPHYPHPHSTKHGREVWCRGWFPLMRVTRGGIRFPPVPGLRWWERG